jgi:predicted transcriptional regulator
MDSVQISAAQTVALTARVVGAYVAAGQADAGEIPALIGQVHAALADAGRPEPAPAPMAAPAAPPAVPVDQSIRAGFLICLEDGRKFRSLKRHLRTVYDLTPDAYRARWGLPADYPMVAPSYSANRSALAKAIGLGAVERRSGVVLWQAGSSVQVA